YVGKASRAVPITNNTPDLEVILTIPELYLKEITVSGFLSEGQSVTVRAVVVNNGTAAAKNVIVRFLCNNLTLGNKTINSIAAGDSKEAAIIWIATKGNNLFEAQVDPDNLIEERANMIQNNNKTKSILINEKPLARLSAEPSEVSTYVDVTFYAGLSSDPDGIVTEYWFEFGDGANSGWTTWTVKHNYTNKGQYNCRVKVKDNFGAESDWSSAVEVRVLNRPPIANVTASVKEAYTYEEIIFYATGSYDGEEPYEQLYGGAGHRIIKYYWDFGDGIAIATTEPIVSHNYSDNGTYIVALVAQDNDFDNSTKATLSVLILNRAPTALFRVTPTIASVNDKLQFNATSAKDLDGEIANYTWDFGDGSKGYGAVCEHSYTQPGIYTVTLTVSDDDGANSTSIAVVEIKRLPTWLELYYKEVYVTGAIICVAGAVFFAFRWYAEAKRREEEVKVWAEKRGIAKEEALKEKLREWAEEKKKVKTIDERIKEWAAKREADKKIREERLKEWAEKREEEKRKKELEKWAEKKREKKVK
ncbi:MAG: PKD domain-containing protein, partial [Candidatus Thermoplasmatota archaeon]|nr:PKD domain-containing protein [Candidatus Thermoplasmatota archaeon]